MVMKIEMWFGSRRDKKLIELTYSDEKEIQPLLKFIEENYPNAKCHVKPTREHDFKDSQGNLYWFKEMMMKPHNKKTFFELVIVDKNGESIPKRRKLYDRYKKSDTYPIETGMHQKTVNEEVLNAMMDQIIIEEMEENE